MRLLNAVGRRAGHRDRLDAEEMLWDARRRTGLADLGPDTDQAYRLLVDAVDREARLTTLGRLVVGRLVRSHLARRLQVVEALRQRPDLAVAPVRRPLFVVGLPRTGTTLLHNLLAQADGSRPLLARDVVQPVPPVLRGAAYDTRGLRYWASVRGMYYLGPGRRRLHDYNAGPVECLRLLARSFVCFAFPNMVHVPSYERWLWEQDGRALVSAYELHRMQLQTLQADGRRGHWVLKAPAHLPALEALLTVYPDASVVLPHRSPATVVASLSSLVARNHALLAEEPDLSAVGREVLARTLRTLERVERTRAALGDDRIIDVGYRELLTDPVGAVRMIHERIGHPLPPASIERMRRWLADNPQGKHGAHRYGLEQYGLDAATVDRLTARYRTPFDG
ncbi:sulfotransferase family protein [Geodermatophilus marinus]|uniref:sulfotransferase family protein n=1 Tax=Geodermatophilus sp. LHW52908 TaxID=2303986 RepID=UPI0013146E17|nr:sulfotransferase [Geodermatophilus sp. LHW52908]